MERFGPIKWLRQLWREPEALERIRSRPLLGMAAAFTTVLLFALVQILLRGVVENLYFFFFYPAIVISVFLAGLRGGIFASLFSSACVAFWFMPHAPSRFLSTQDLLRLALFVGNGFIISAGIEFVINRFRLLVSVRLLELKKQSEERLREKAAEAVEVSIKLRRANLELERSNGELAQFAHIASHDMKEPLRVISNYVELLELQYASNLDENAKLFIRFAADGAKRMHALINDILRYSELDGELPSAAQMKLENAVNESLENLAEQVRESDARITVRPLPALRVPPRQIVQVFQNLISNALKFRRSNAPLAIEIGSRSEPDHVLVWVKDNGIGIEASQAKKVFQLFKRVHSRERYPGSGIGLASCKRIVERLNGKIWFDSTPGAGTTFYFTLPKSDATLREDKRELPTWDQHFSRRGQSC